MLEIKNLSYRDSKFQMKNISFALEDGYLMTLLGRNGAGKTTLLDMIYGCLKPKEGKVLWNGSDVTGIKAMEATADNLLYHEQVAYVGSQSWCIESISCQENLDLFTDLYQAFDRDYFDKVLKLIDFTALDLETKYEELSTGKKMQLQLAFCLARHPKLLLLDEPMANLDPVVKTDLWELLLSIIEKENISIIISTHLVEEVNDITDYIGVLENGSMLIFGDRDQVLKENNLRSLVE